MGEAEPPFFEEAQREAEVKIRRVLGGESKITVHVQLDDRLLDVVELIDSRMFREELRYTREEIRERGDRRGFVLFLVSVEERPICVLYGYQEAEAGFYLDTLATLIEQRGIGSTVHALALVYCYEAGYTTVTLNTEESDEKGRPLRRFYEALGYRLLRTDPAEGDVMQARLDPGHVLGVYRRYILGQSPSTPAQPAPGSPG